ncbi:MAG TPA: carboxypeptidase regulatory-like domain-containing protein [Planctomycetota bacterium]
MPWYRTMAVLFAVALLYGVWWMAAYDPALPQMGGAPHEASSPVEPAGSTLPGAAAASERDAVDAGSAARDDREAELRGVVRGPDRLPLAGARVVAELSEIEEYPLLDRGPRASRRVVGETATDDEGCYRLRLADGRQHRVTASMKGLAPQVRAGCRAGSRVDFELDHGAVLMGTVRAADGGAVVPGTRIALRKQLAVGAARLGELVTDAAGAFRFDGLPSGTCLVEVQPETLASPRDIEVQLRAGAVTVHDIKLTAGITIRGRVLDAATRAGIVGAQVSEGFRGRSVATQAGGEFELRGFEPSNNVSLHVSAARYAHAEVSLRPGGSTAKDTATQVEVLLGHGRQVRGVVADGDLRPLVGVYVAACAADHDGHGGWFRSDWCTTETYHDGAFAMNVLRRDMQHTLLLVHPGFATAVYEFPADEAAREIVDFKLLQLRPPASLRGEVRDERGEPVAGHEVELRGHNADRFSGPAPGGYRAIDSYVATRHCETDDRGRFHVTDLAAGKYVVSAQKFASHDRVEVACELALAEQRSGVVLTLVRGLAIEGTVFVADGGKLPKCYCSIDPADGQSTAGDVEVRADGVFRAAGLLPGNYTITVYPYASEEDRAAARSFAAREHEQIAAGSVGLRLEVPVSGPVRGVVYDALRAPVEGALVGAVLGAAVLGSERTDAAGAFVLSAPVGRAVTVMLCSPGLPGVPASFDRARAVASVQAIAGGPAIELVLPAQTR